MNHIPAGGVDTAPGILDEDDVPDSSIGEGMDITIQGANGHVNKRNKTNNKHDTCSIKSRDESDSLQPHLEADMSIGRGMDISICGGDQEKDCHDDNLYNSLDGLNNVKEVVEMEEKRSSTDSLAKEEIISLPGRNVEEVFFDPADEVVVEKCCPEACYNACPCCIGDPDSPFWQLWYKHRLQVSRCVVI